MLLQPFPSIAPQRLVYVYGNVNPMLQCRDDTAKLFGDLSAERGLPVWCRNHLQKDHSDLGRYSESSDAALLVDQVRSSNPALRLVRQPE